MLLRARLQTVLATASLLWLGGSQVVLAQDANVSLPPLPAPAAANPNNTNTGAGGLTADQRVLQQMIAEQANQSSAAPALPRRNANAATSAPVNNAAAANRPTSTFGTIYDPAFQNIIKRQFPLTPEQIKALREIFQTMQRAKVAPVEIPTPVITTRNVLLAPGTIPPVLKMAQGYVSSIVILDETGAPWPIAGFSVGNPSAWDIKWTNGSNILMMQGTGPYETGNMALQLVGLETPVMLTMVNDQKQVDYRVDMRVQGRGPNAKLPLSGKTLPGQTSAVLQSVLDGLAPNGSQELTVVGGQAQAWLYNAQLYLRTRLTILSPSWSATVSSADGTSVYEMNATPVILASQNGSTVELKIEGL